MAYQQDAQPLMSQQQQQQYPQAEPYAPPPGQQQQPYDPNMNSGAGQPMPVMATEPPRRLECGYVFAQTHAQFGISGKPRARPFFDRWHAAEQNLRDPHFCCARWELGPNVPDHWWNGTLGYVSYYFSDLKPHDRENNTHGVHQCEMRMPNGAPCGYRAEIEGCCEGNACWCAGSPAYAMAEHLQMVHGVAPPQKRQWATGLCETQGCLETWCCSPCNGSRQMNALSGQADTFSWGWCLIFTFLGCRTARSADGKTYVYWIPPHFYVALLTRYNVVQLQNIDEGRCESACKICCCALCSTAQTYRELSVAGVWPGAYCSQQPPDCALPSAQPAIMR